MTDTTQPEALRLADELCSGNYADHLSAMAAAELRRLQTLSAIHEKQAAEQAETIVRLGDVCERETSDRIAALDLVSRIRHALGDNGQRMQDELIEHCKSLVENAGRLQTEVEALRADAERWRTWVSLKHEIRAEWASNLSIVAVLTQWVDQAAIDAAKAMP